MESKYSEWIDANIPTPSHAYRQCMQVTKSMLAAFPELTRVRGYYHCPCVGRIEHWWLKTIDDEIVDPTASQFVSGGDGIYEELDESLPHPTHKCLECGALYCPAESDNFCSITCAGAFRRSLYPHEITR